MNRAVSFFILCAAPLVCALLTQCGDWNASLLAPIRETITEQGSIKEIRVAAYPHTAQFNKDAAAPAVWGDLSWETAGWESQYGLVISGTSLANETRVLAPAEYAISPLNTAEPGVQTVTVTLNDTHLYPSVTTSFYILIADESDFLTHEVLYNRTTFGSLNEAISNSASSDNVYILNDITLTDSLNIPSGKEITLTVFGGSTEKIITRGSSFTDGSLFTISGGSLTLDAGLGNGSLTLDGNKVTATDAPLVKVSGGTFTMGAGVTLRNNHNSTGEDATAYPHGGGVHVNGGRFEMTGGTISGNEASIGGGGVFVTNNGMFTMSGNSTISGNAAKSGGGVLAYNGTFEMSGGEISNNDGGGVLLALGGTFKMSGTAVISNNTAITSGSGVYVDGNATFKMGGGAVVKQEVYLAHGSSSPAKITVTGTLKPPSGEKYSAKIGLGPIDDNPVVLVSEGYSLTATDIEKFEPLNDGAFLVYNNYQGILARPKGTDNAFYVNSGGTLQSASTLKDAITDVFGGTADDPAPIYVANNVTLTETIGIDGKHIKLTVLGTEKKTIVRGSSFSSGSLFTIPSGGSLTLDAGDSTLTLDGNKNNNNGNENQLPLVTVTGGTLTMSEGVTLQNNNNAFVQCGGVLVSSGIFNMRGGTIAYMYGSGVWVSSGATFKMTGGTISNNVASNRDGVYVDSSSSTFEMEGKGVVSGMVYLHGTGGQDYGKITVTGKLELPEDTLVQIYMDTQPSPRVVLTGTPDYNLIQDDVNKFQVVYPNDKSLELNTDDNKAVLSQ